MQFDPRDLILWSGLALIGTGLWLWTGIGPALTSVGVILFLLGFWSSL